MSEERSNDEWLRSLREAGTAREAATGDLRNVLTRNLLPLLTRRGLDAGCVEDVVQEAILRLLDRLDRFRGDSRFLTWATAIGVRTGLELKRKGLWASKSLADVAGEGTVDALSSAESDDEPPERRARRAEILEALGTAIQNELTERQRTVLLAELSGMPLSEIASRTDSNRNAIYKVGHDARRKLKQALERAGFDAHAVREVFDG